MENIYRVPIGFVEITTPSTNGQYQATIRICGGDITFNVPGPFVRWEDARNAGIEKAQSIGYVELREANLEHRARNKRS